MSLQCTSESRLWVNESDVSVCTDFTKISHDV